MATIIASDEPGDSGMDGVQERFREEHTPGPWGWFGSTRKGNQIYLATVRGGRRFVMGFRRKGMSGAEPTFQVNHRMVPASTLAIFEVCPEALSADDERVYRHDIVGLRSADARLIAAAPDMLAALIAVRARFQHLRLGPDEDAVLERVAAAILKAESQT